MSWWKPRRSFDPSSRAIPKAASRHSLRDVSSYTSQAFLSAPLPTANWNNESSTSLPTYAEVIGSCPSPSDKEARRQKLATFLNEMQYDEELRLTEARKPPGLISNRDLGLSYQDDQISQPPDSTSSPHKDTLKVPPVLPSLDRRRTLTSIDEVSDLFPEPEMLGPKTSDLYKQRPTSAPLRKSSVENSYVNNLEIPFCSELDSLQISSVIELPTSNNKSRYSTSLEYGNKRYNTLPGEPFPLAERRRPSPQPSIIPELGTTEDEKEHEAFQAFIQPDFDPRTGLEIAPPSIQHPYLPIKENIITNSITT